MRKQGDQKTLAIHMGALGDLILALPALAELAKAGPVEAWGPSLERLSLACAPAGPLARTAVLPHGLFGEDAAAASAITTRFERIVVFAKRDGPLARNLPGARFLSTDGPGHVSDLLLEQLGARAETLRHPVLRTERRDDGTLVVQPGAGGRAKRWAPEKFAAVARSSGLEVVCLLGPAELDPPERALRIADRVVEAPAMGELVRLLSGARAFLGNDAGVTHLASAVGTPTVAVFGPTDPARGSPRGRAPVSVVRAPGGDLGALAVQPVLAALTRVLRESGGDRLTAPP